MPTATYPYDIYYPPGYTEDDTKKWPLIVFLHGAGERGTDLQKVKAQGLPKLLAYKKEFPFVVVWPQCPSGSYWSVEVLDKWLAEVLSHTQIDSTRQYLTGISMGGYGTWYWACAFPDRFAAINPICGGGDPSKVIRIKNLPVWTFHGSEDNIVPLSESQLMVDALRKVGGKVKFTVYPSLKHDCWTLTYHNPALYNWFLSHQKQT